MVKKKKYFWRCRYCRKRHRADIERIKIAYEDVKEKAIVIPLQCSSCGKESKVRIIGLYESGGKFEIKTLRRDERLSAGESYHTSDAKGSRELVKYLLSQPEVTLESDIKPEIVTLAFQVFKSMTKDGPIINSRMRAVEFHPSFLDYTRCQLYEMANSQAKEFLLDSMDRTMAKTDDLTWKPGNDITKTPMVVPKVLPTLQTLNTTFWIDFRTVATIAFFWVFQVELKGKSSVAFCLKGFTHDNSDEAYRYFHIPEDL